MEEIIYRLAGEEDVDRINAFYHSVYGRIRTKAEFDWEFNSSPAGRSIYAIAEHDNQIVGTQCIIPYYIVTQENKTLLSGKSEDTLVSPNYRGKQLFEKMYAVLIEACEKSNIEFIWGFTYAVKPFLKLGFLVPFHSQMGLLVLKPMASAKYLASLSSKNTALDKFKISALSLASWAKALTLSLRKSKEKMFALDLLSLNKSGFNYLKNKNTFGLKLDEPFLNYRISTNPYNKRYKTCNYIEKGVLLLSVTFNVTDQNVGYIIHIYRADGLKKDKIKDHLRSILNLPELKVCHTIRFWGFVHNKQNREEIDLLSSCGFTFINRGISFVWLPLNTSLQINPMNFVLSRMSSQGTD